LAVAQKAVDTLAIRCSFCHMWRLLLALLISTAPALAQESQTAYEALRVVGTQLKRDYVNHIISVTGVNGDPQPQVWKILIDDPSARGGIREIEVENGRVFSERTPVRSAVGPAIGAIIDTERLNLDSSGAYAVARHTAESSDTVFSTANYTLRNDERGNPVWIVSLQTDSGESLGTIHIGTNHGSVTRVEGMFSGGNRKRIVTQSQETEDAEDADEDADDDGIKARIKRVFRETGEETKRIFHNVRRSFADFIRGD
jgi:hypothetical protein